MREKVKSGCEKNQKSLNHKCHPHDLENAQASNVSHHQHITILILFIDFWGVSGGDGIASSSRLP